MGAPRFDDIQGDINEAPAPRFDDIEGEPRAPGKPDIGAVRSGVLGFANGGTAGFVDEIGGALGKLLLPERVKVNTAPQAGDSPEVLALKKQIAAEQEAQPTNYDLVQKKVQQDQRAAMDQHPVAYVGGNVAGELAKDTALAQFGVPVTSLPYQLASGALSGAGNSDENTPGGRVGGAALGAGAALVGHGVGKYVVGPVVGAVGRGALSKIPQSVKDFAAERAYKAAGPMLKNYRMLTPEQRLEVGRDLLDENIVKWGSNVEGISKRANQRLGEVGDMIGQARDAIDRVIDPNNLPTGVELADQIEKQIVAPLQGSPVQRQFAPAVQKMADEFRAEGTNPISLNKLTEWKAQLNDRLYNSPDPSFPVQQMRKVGGVLRESEDNVVQGVAGPHASAYDKAKRLYGNLAGVADFSADKALRENANRFISPSDYGFGLMSGMADVAKGGSQAEGTLMGMVLSMGHKLARERGNAAVAVTADAIADSAPMQWMARLPAGAAQQYLPVLASAAAKGPQNLATAIFVLTQRDPKFRQLQAQAKNGN